MVRVLRKVVDAIDDGWWEGELDGRTGLFPSLVVEECREDGEPLTPQVICTTVTVNFGSKPRSPLVMSHLNPVYVISNPSFCLCLRLPSGC